MRRFSHSIPILLGILAGFSVIHSALADTPSVTAVLSNSDVMVGQTVQLQIRVNGAGQANTPQNIVVDGLEIHATGSSRQVEMRNFNVTSSVTYNYTILPLKPGTFKIPPQKIQIGSSQLTTPELKLTVADEPGGRGTARAAPGHPNVNPNPQTTGGKTVFAELIVPKTSAYVGEMIPVVIRMGFRGRVVGLEGPEIAGQGFTMQKLQTTNQPQLESIDGKDWEVYTFKTAISAARPGKFDVGPVRATAQMIVPTQSRSSRSRSPFDMFNMDDPFSDPFFADPFGRREKRDVPIESGISPLEVKPLPANAPANFSGAVGNFTMTVEANPKSVQVGDPITVTATVSGRGNFDRVNAPALEDERGWHKYPPSAKFKQDDDVGISGAKTFETVLSPNEKKQSLPPFAFSFFDPLKQTYVTLRNDPIGVRVEGGSAPGSSAAAPASPAAPPTATAKATPSPAQRDILYQLPESTEVRNSFVPLYGRPNFWFAQLAPFVTLLGFVAWKLRKARLDNREAQRTAALHHEAAELMRSLRRADGSPEEYFSRASRAVQVKTALARNVDPNTVDVEAAAKAFNLDASAQDRLRRLFEQNDELRYSGARNGGGIVAPESRRELLELIENLRS